MFLEFFDSMDGFFMSSDLKFWDRPPGFTFGDDDYFIGSMEDWAVQVIQERRGYYLDSDCAKSRQLPVNWLQVPRGVWYHASWHISLVKTGPSFCFCLMLWTTTWGRTTRSVSLMRS